MEIYIPCAICFAYCLYRMYMDQFKPISQQTLLREMRKRKIGTR